MAISYADPRGSPRAEADLDPASPAIRRELTSKAIKATVAATVGLMASYSTVGNAPLGLLVVPISHAFGIGRGEFGLMTGAAMLIGAALSPFAGRAMDRFGARRVVLPGMIVFGAVQLLLSIVPMSLAPLAVLLLAQGAISGLLSPLAFAKVISLWFHRRRGLMLGISASLGIGCGSGVAVALVGMLIAAGGWRLAYLGTGIYVLIAAALVVFPFLHEPATIENAAQSSVSAELPGLTRREAIGALPLRLVMILVISCVGSLTTIMGHGPALLASRGLDIGPLFLGCAALGTVIGQMSSGVLLDRIDSPKAGLPFALAALVGGVTILHFGTNSGIVLASAIVMGLGQGAETGLASYYISRFCGMRAYAGIFGLVMALVMLSAGIFPAIAGYVFDATGGYRDILPLIDCMLALPPLLILLMPPYRFDTAPPSTFA